MAGGPEHGTTAVTELLSLAESHDKCERIATNLGGMDAFVGIRTVWGLQILATVFRDCNGASVRTPSNCHLHRYIPGASATTWHLSIRQYHNMDSP